MTEKAGSVFPAADILTYYEKNIGWNSSDRAFIIENGVQEWLLTVITEHTSKTAAAERLCIREPYTNQSAADLVILIANLIGGVIQ